MPEFRWKYCDSSFLWHPRDNPSRLQKQIAVSISYGVRLERLPRHFPRTWCVCSKSFKIYHNETPLRSDQFFSSDLSTIGFPNTSRARLRAFANRSPQFSSDYRILRAITCICSGYHWFSGKTINIRRDKKPDWYFKSRIMVLLSHACLHPPAPPPHPLKQ